MDNDQITKIINSIFPDAESFAQMMKLLGGVGQRLKLEVERDAAQRAIGELHQKQQDVSQSAQVELQKMIAELQAQIQEKQNEAAALQAQIDAVNSQLPDLLK